MLTMQQLDFLAIPLSRRKRTPHAICRVVISREAQESFGLALAAQSPVLSLVAEPPQQRSCCSVLSADFAVFHETSSSAGQKAQRKER